MKNYYLPRTWEIFTKQFASQIYVLVFDFLFPWILKNTSISFRFGMAKSLKSEFQLISRNTALNNIKSEAL